MISVIYPMFSIFIKFIHYITAAIFVRINALTAVLLLVLDKIVYWMNKIRHKSVFTHMHVRTHTHTVFILGFFLWQKFGESPCGS